MQSEDSSEEGRPERIIEWILALVIVSGEENHKPESFVDW
jgi:hypothetical protein